MSDKQYEELLQPIQTWLSINNAPQKSDIIFVFGGIRQPLVWDRAVELYVSGFASKILVTGGFGPLSKARGVENPEAQTIKEYFIKNKIPESAILIEDKATNTLENIIFSMKLLAEKDLQIHQAILVSKPFHMRRCFATFKKHFPSIELLCCPPKGSVVELLDRSKKEYAERLLAELDRLEEYANKGDLIYQEVPEEILNVSHELKRMLLVIN